MNAKEKARYQRLISAYKVSERWRASEHEEAWRDYLRLYANGTDGDVQERQRACGDRKVNLTFQTVEIMVSAALERYPKIYARPWNEQQIEIARLAEKVLSFWEYTNTTSREVERAHRDAAIFGDGFLKTVWVSEQTRRVAPDPIDLERMIQARDEVQASLEFEITNKMIEDFLEDMTVQVISNKPMTRRISPFDVWLDSQSTDKRDMAWLVHRYRRGLDSCRHDPGFRLKQRRALEVRQSGGGFENWGNSKLAQLQMPMGGLDQVDLVELWDLHEERLYIIPYADRDDPEKALYAGNFPQAIGQPITFLPFYDMPDSLYAMGVVELTAPLQDELNDIRNEQTMARRRMRQKFATLKGLIDDDGVEKLQSDTDGDVIVIDPDFLDGRSLRESLIRLEGLQQNPETYNQSAIIQSDLYNITGVTEYQRGLVSNYRSASEVNTVNQFTTARLGRMLRDVQHARLEVARKEIGLAAQFMTQDEVLTIVGEDKDLLAIGGFHDGRNTLFPFNRKDIAGEYTLMLEPGSYTPESKDERLQRLMQAFGMMAAFPELDRKEVLREIMQELGVVNPDRFIDPNPTLPPPGQQNTAGVTPPGGGRPGGTLPAEIAGGIAGGLG